MKIRPVIKRDIPRIIKLIAEIWNEYDCVLDTETEEKALLAPGEFFRARNGEFWIAAEKTKIVATVAVMLDKKKNAELKYLYVGKDFRKIGLGEKLTRTAIKFAEMKGAAEMILWSDTRFTKAHKLYEKLGFEQFGERQLRDLNNSKEIGFRLKLAVSA